MILASDPDQRSILASDPDQRLILVPDPDQKSTLASDPDQRSILASDPDQKSTFTSDPDPFDKKPEPDPQRWLCTAWCLSEGDPSDPDRCAGKCRSDPDS